MVEARIETQIEKNIEAIEKMAEDMEKKAAAQSAGVTAVTA